MLMLLSIMASLMVGGFLLALVSDAFAYELSRVVEAAFDFAEYRAARRRANKPKANGLREQRAVYEASYSHAG